MANETVINFFDIPIGHFSDRSIRRLLSDKENIRGLLEIMDINLATCIDFSRIIPISRSFIFDNLREQISDLVFLVLFRSKSATKDLEICLLIEHQSTVDSSMVSRLLSYENQIWDSQRREWTSDNTPQSRRRLHTVISTLFYTGDQRWNTPLTLNSIMDTPDELSRFVPKFDILFLDLKTTSPETLTKTNHLFGWLMTVLQKEHASVEEISTALIKAISHINTLGEEKAYQRRTAISYLISLIVHRRPSEQRDELITLVAENIQRPSDREELEKMTQTTADLLFAQGKEQGIAQGKEQGIEEGKEQGIAQGKEQGIEQGERKGTIESILALLGTRFQPNAVQALKPTLETINLLRLKELLLAAPQTQSLEAFTQTLHE